MTANTTTSVSDTRETRKARGAFFTPDPISAFLAGWAIRSSHERVLEPSAGDAAFLVQAVARLKELGSHDAPEVHGVEIHPHSARIADARVREAGGFPVITVSDFFLVEPIARYSAVIGNPPFIRYQDFAGEPRARSRRAALRAGVPLSGLASSWAAFVVHSALFLETGGRLALVLPAELLSVNYASPVRRFLFEKFKTVELVMFTERVFPEAEADVVLLLADGYQEGPAGHATIVQSQNAAGLDSMTLPLRWSPKDPAGKWTASLLSARGLEAYSEVSNSIGFVDLKRWGNTTLGMVTGNNHYFALSDARVRELELANDDVLPLSPPGSSHLRGLRFAKADWNSLGESGSARWLFRPDAGLSAAAKKYVEVGEAAGVNEAYKCRVRNEWWRVPLVAPADLFLTYMNADTPRLTTNAANAHYLNSVHGLFLRDDVKTLGKRLLPIASLNSATLLGAETVGRSYGGGLLKVEPREADVLPVPSPEVVSRLERDLSYLSRPVTKLLANGKLLAASALVDEVVLSEGLRISSAHLEEMREARAYLYARRVARASRSE